MMDTEQLQFVFRQKIHNELGIFKCQVLQKTKDEIWELSYKILCMTEIHRVLMEHGSHMSGGQLTRCIQTNCLLEFIYSEWLKNPVQEHSLCSFIQQMNQEMR